jgi:damage-control phosphatase, subfamily I
MKPHPECGACLVHWVFERAAPHTPDAEIVRLVRSIVGILVRDVSPMANLGSLCNSTVHKVFEFTQGLAEHYENLKEKSNENAKKVLPEAMEYIRLGKTPNDRLTRACMLAAAANVAPLNAPSSPYTFQEIRDLMNHGIDKVMIDDLLGTLKESRHVLYVTDNSGEIGFDSLVIQQIKELGPKVTLVVKKQTFFEDATMNDAHAFGLDKLADEVVTVPGFMAPHEMDTSLAALFASSDFIIAKGTGSYEALHDELGSKKAAFMLKIKCKPIARELGIDEGGVIVKLQ